VGSTTYTPKYTPLYTPFGANLLDLETKVSITIRTKLINFLDRLHE